MGLFDRFGKAMGVSKEMDIEEYMSSAEMENVDILNEPADMYVKPLNVVSESDLKVIEDELHKKNIILMNIEELSKRPNTANNMLAELKTFVGKINGDIARIDEKRIMVTPAKVKIIKSKKSVK
ncbi:MAG: cell division protein SepF [Candidatus Micrarchaeaceae archaeon]